MDEYKNYIEIHVHAHKFRDMVYSDNTVIRDIVIFDISVFINDFMIFGTL